MPDYTWAAHTSDTAVVGVSHLKRDFYNLVLRKE